MTSVTHHSRRPAASTLPAEFPESAATPTSNASSAVLGSAKLAATFPYHPALIVNPEAKSDAVLAWVFAEIENLNAFLEIMACGTTDAPMDACEFARHVYSRLEPALEGLRRVVDGEVDQ